MEPGRSLSNNSAISFSAVLQHALYYLSAMFRHLGYSASFSCRTRRVDQMTQGDTRAFPSCWPLDYHST